MRCQDAVRSRGVAGGVGLTVVLIAIGLLAARRLRAPGEPPRWKTEAVERIAPPAGGRRREGERPGRARVGDVPGDEWIRRDRAGRHVPRGACPARRSCTAGRGISSGCRICSSRERRPSSTSTRPRPVAGARRRGLPAGGLDALVSPGGAGQPRRWRSRPSRPTGPADGRICWFAEVTPPSFVPAEVRDRSAKAAGDEPRTAGGQQRRPVELRARRRRGVRQDDGRDAPAVATEYERFLFYRGLGRSRLPMRAQCRRRRDAGARGRRDAGGRRPAHLRAEGRGRPRGVRIPPRAGAGRGGHRRDPVDGRTRARWRNSPRPSPTTWPRG